VAQTVKGWGFTSVLGSNGHGKPATEAEKVQALEALDAMAQHLGAALTKGDLRRPPVSAVEVPRLQPTQEVPSFREAMQRYGQEGMLDKGTMAPRRAYGVALRALGQAYSHVVALDADVRNSTYSETFWHDEALRERFFECRIAEQNMLSCAGGLAAGGKLPFVSTFGKFLVRAYDQLEMGLISRFNLKLIGSHVGVSLAADGPSQMALSDVAFFRAWTTVRTHEGRPLLYLLQPADAYAAYALTVARVAHEGPCYLRTLRPDVPFLYNEATAFSLGGHRVLTEGHDLCIIAAGYMVHEAQKALPLLREQGITATLVDLYSLPFDEVAILELAQENHGQVLTIEDNYGAGLGSAVAEALAFHGGSYTLMQMYVRQIPKSGRTPDEVLRFLQLSASDIVHTAVSMLDVASR
jgi:transketolase